MDNNEFANPSHLNKSNLPLPDDETEKLTFIKEQINTLLLSPEKKIDYGKVEGHTLVADREFGYRSKPGIAKVGEATSDVAAGKCTDMAARFLTSGTSDSPSIPREAIIVDSPQGRCLVVASTIDSRLSHLLKFDQNMTRKWNDKETVFVVIAPTMSAGEMDMWVVGQKGEQGWIIPGGERVTEYRWVPSLSKSATAHILLPEDQLVGSLHIRFKNEGEVKDAPPRSDSLGVFGNNGLRILRTPSQLDETFEGEDIRKHNEIPVPGDILPVLTDLRAKYPYIATATSDTS